MDLKYLDTLACCLKPGGHRVPAYPEVMPDALLLPTPEVRDTEMPGTFQAAGLLAVMPRSYNP